jgi:Malic enzyme
MSFEIFNYISFTSYVTEKWYQLAVEIHKKYGGKISVLLKVPIRSMQDFAVYYTPGIAEVSRRIHKNPELAFELTSRWNLIGVVTDGTRVLGLGNIGPEAAYPVMEGKGADLQISGRRRCNPYPN